MLIDAQTLSILQAEYAVQFDTTVAWWPSLKDSTGKPIVDAYGKHTYPGPAVTLPARVVSQMQEVYSAQGVMRVLVAKVYLPPRSGVRAGDALLTDGSTDPTKAPPILDVNSIPDDANPIFDQVRLGAA